jgi:hypothetical protein
VKSSNGIDGGDRTTVAIMARGGQWVVVAMVSMRVVAAVAKEGLTTGEPSSRFERLEFVEDCAMRRRIIGIA